MWWAGWYCCVRDGQLLIDMAYKSLSTHNNKIKSNLVMLLAWIVGGAWHGVFWIWCCWSRWVHPPTAWLREGPGWIGWLSEPSSCWQVGVGSAEEWRGSRHSEGERQQERICVPNKLWSSRCTHSPTSRIHIDQTAVTKTYVRLRGSEKNDNKDRRNKWHIQLLVGQGCKENMMNAIWDSSSMLGTNRDHKSKICIKYERRWITNHVELAFVVVPP